MQHSCVYSQRYWPGAGDIDDCWVVSAEQCQNVLTPDERLPGVPTFRAAAGNPDDPNEPDGGNLAQIVRGIEGCHPRYKGKLKRLRGASMDALKGYARERRPVSLAVLSAKLPAKLRYGFDGPLSFHQVSILVPRDGVLLFANPLAPPQSRWDETFWAAITPAILAYGRARAGTDGVWAVVFPTEEDMDRSTALINAARSEGYASAKAKALAAVEAI